MYYPLIFKSVYKQMLWGGTKLRDIYRRKTPYERTGESWDITCRRDGMSIVKNGIHEGLALRTLVKKDTEGILGAKFRNYPRFPLLVKLIDANDDLSVQVHPTDEYAEQNNLSDAGKNEMWYILSAEPNSSLILGLKDGVTKKDFIGAVENNSVIQCLNKVPIKQGDIIDIPAGLVHAIGGGVVLAEIQQNSDLTFRIYDYNRTDANGKKRELHTEKALDCIDFTDSLPKKPVTPRPAYNTDGAYVSDCIKNTFFTVRYLDIKSHLELVSTPEYFHIITVTKGDMYIAHAGGELRLRPGDSALIPARLGEYTVSGLCEALYAHI